MTYIVPRRFIDTILPFTIDPAPAEMVRIIVGRVEIVTPATVKAVSAALASGDRATLNKYGRFLQTDSPDCEGGAFPLDSSKSRWSITALSKMEVGHQEYFRGRHKSRFRRAADPHGGTRRWIFRLSLRRDVLPGSCFAHSFSWHFSLQIT